MPSLGRTIREGVKVDNPIVAAFAQVDLCIRRARLHARVRDVSRDPFGSRTPTTTTFLLCSDQVL